MVTVEFSLLCPQWTYVLITQFIEFFRPTYQPGCPWKSYLSEIFRALTTIADFFILDWPPRGLTRMLTNDENSHHVTSRDALKKPGKCSIWAVMVENTF